MKRLRIGVLLAGIFLLGTPARAQTTVTTATVKDLTGAVVPTGQVTFDLRPSLDTTISGNARFTPQTIVCTINQASVGTNQAVRAANSVTISGLTGHTFVVNDVLTETGMTDSSFNGTFVIGFTTATSITYLQTLGNATSGGGILSALRSNPGPGSCTVTQNTALIPIGTYYQVGIWPSFARTSVFNFYALSTPVDLSTVVPTPGQTPGYSFVDIFQNQSVGGNKTFTGLVTFSGGAAFPGAVTFGNGITVTNGIATDTLTASSAMGIGGSTASVTNAINGPSGWALAVAGVKLFTLTTAALTTPVQIVSSLATGTPPLSIASTTLVPNLNVANWGGISETNAPAGAGQVCISSSTTQCAWTANATQQYKLENFNVTPVTASNTVAETTLMTFTLSANELAATQALDILARGLFSNNIGVTKSCTLKLYLDANVISRTVATSLATGLNAGWKIQGTYMLVTGGAGGTINAHADVFWDDQVVNNLSNILDVNGSTFGFDTTATHIIKVTATMNVADPTVSTSQTQMLIARIG